MSAEDKDPIPKQDTTSESSESHSDSEVNKAEENLEHLKIQERLEKVERKDFSDESKPIESPNQKGTVESKYDDFNEPTAGPSGLRESRRLSSDGDADPELKAVGVHDVGKIVEGVKEDAGTTPMEAGEVEGVEEAAGTTPMEAGEVEGVKEDAGTTPMEAGEVEGVKEDVGTTPMEADTDTTESSPCVIQKSPGPSCESEYRGPLVPSASFFERKSLYQKLLAQHSSSSNNQSFASDANTLSDVPDISSEVADISGEGSDYQDVAENLQKKQSPAYVTALERQYSEASDSNISEIQDDLPPPQTATSSSDISSLMPSELINLQKWGLVGQVGYYRRDIKDTSESSNQNVTDDSISSVRAASEPLEVLTKVRHQRHGDLDLSLPFESACEKLRKDSSDPEHLKTDDSSIKSPKCDERSQASGAGAGSPSDRKKSPRVSDSSSGEKGVLTRLRPRIKPDVEKKGKLVSKKPKAVLKCGSESPEPKSTSSDEYLFKESTEMKSLGESSNPEMSKKSWKKSGGLRTMQRSTMTSKDSVIIEEEGLTSLSRESPKLMETKDASPEKMETTEGAKAGIAHSTPSTLETSSRVFTSDAETMVTEQELNFEVPEERKTAKSKRPGAKLSNSPPSDEIPSSSQPKAPINRPKKKKSRQDKKPRQTRRTRHDADDPDFWEQTESSASDQSDSYAPEEQSTKL